MDRIDGVHFIQMYGGNYMSHIVCDNGLPVLGIYPLTNTGSLVIHSMDDEQVQVSLNGGKPESCERVSQIKLDDDGEYDMVDGFLWGEMLVPFDDVMRL